MRALLLLALLTLSGVAQARWYQVEVVVFRHNVESTTGGEQWPEITELPDYSASIDLITDMTALADEPGESPAGGAVAFKALEKNERATLDIERRLRNSSEYTPLLSAAWRQPSFGIDGAKRVHLSDLARAATPHPPASAAPTLVEDTAAPVATIEGTVALKVARQMAVDVDFTYDHDGVPVRLRESRALRLREVHYFDHPLFGVLVQVLPWIPPDEDPAAGAGSDEPVDEGTDAGRNDTPVEPD